MDKEARLSSARKKLKNFRRKREVKTPPIKHDVLGGNGDNVNKPISNGNEAASDEIKPAYIPSDSHSTAGSAESILQVSSTLNGIIAEVESLTENGSYFVGSDRAASEYSNSSENVSLFADDAVKDLQKRNIELMKRVGNVEVEREQLKTQCHQLSEQITALSRKNSESEAAHAQLEAQKQTIEILVCEKQDLQRHLSDTKLKAQSGTVEQMVLHETLQSYKKQIEAYETEIYQNRQKISSMESRIGPLTTEYENYREESSKLGQALEREKLQTAELGMKLNMRETDFNQLLASHSDMQEKLNMAEVLLQQYSSRKDNISDTAKLEAENRHLSQDLQNSNLAIEKLADERDHIIKQHKDSQEDWENHIHHLQLQVETLQQALEEAESISQLKSEQSMPVALSEDVKPHEVTILTVNNSCQTENFFEETITALSHNNRQLSQLMQEKELQIQQLENELQDANSLIQGHENLLDSSRNDKVTISRALTQNKQLKEQLEEIENSFITISNDKMDLATQLGTLESINKNLNERLNEITSAFNGANQDLADHKVKMLAFEESAFNNHVPSLQTVDEQLDMKDFSEPETIANSTAENELQIPSTTLQNGTDSVSEHEDISEPCPELPDIAHPPESNETHPKMMEMLQQKFTAVMQERADLINRVEMLEHANTQLQNECDTIGEYITLYHNQRQLLKQRHHEKDVYISNIIQEREEMRGKVEQLQTLVGTVLKSSAHSRSMLGDSEMNSSRESLKIDSALPQPDLVPESDTLVGKPIPSNVDQIPVPYSIESAVDDLAATQILNLLQQMKKPSESPSPTHSRPSGFCMHYIGPYTAI